MKFKLNQRVAWVSQSRGTSKEKHGRVIRIVPPQKHPLGGFSAWGDTHSLQLSAYGQVRDHESYLIEVREGKGKRRLYWPVVAKLEGD